MKWQFKIIRFGAPHFKTLFLSAYMWLLWCPGDPNQKRQVVPLSQPVSMRNTDRERQAVCFGTDLPGKRNLRKEQMLRRHTACDALS